MIWYGMAPGTRVRMNNRCPWADRRGLTGVVVAPRAGVYPQPVPGYRLVLIDDDPLMPLGRWWSCQTHVDTLDPLEQA